MDPAKDEQEECQSSSESGWTMYIGSPVSHTFNSQHDDDGNHDGYHHAHDDDDDSEASDASSGPSNYQHPWMKEEGRALNHGSKHVHGEEQSPLDDEKMKKKARAHSEQHVVAKKKGVLGDGRRRKNQHQLPQKASSHVR